MTAAALHAALLAAAPGRPARAAATDHAFLRPLSEPGANEFWIAPPR